METITDADYAYDLELFAKTPIQAESLAYPGAGSKWHWSLFTSHLTKHPYKTC